jgi:hypothetical protein
MPWTSNSIFEARRNFVTLALTPNSNIRGLCRRFNISANTGYQTLERYRAEGEKGLQDRSRAPHRTLLRCSKATERAVLSVRADHPTWGGRRIASYLQLFGAVSPLDCDHLETRLETESEPSKSPYLRAFYRLIAELSPVE